MISIGLAIAVLTVGAMLDAAGAEEKRPSRLPDEVVAFVGRRSSCTEWTTKARSDRDAADISKILAYLHCDTVIRDEAILREEYRSDPRILAAFDGTWVRVVKRLPGIVFVPDPSDGHR